MYKNKQWMISQLKNKNAQQIIKENNFSETTFYRWVKKHNIELPKKQKKEKIKKPKPQYQDKEWLINMLEKHKNASNISKVTGYNRYTINDWINKYDLKNEYEIRKYKINENYFEIIDTEHKAYWLGFLMADGYMNLNQKSFGICLKKTDDYIIKEFLNDINYNGSITYSDKDARIDICSVKMCKDLINLHISPRKSGCEVVPDQVPDHLLKHFVRGFFDGDGSIPNNQKSLTFFLCSSSYNILEDINDVFKRKFDFSYSIKRRTENDRKKRFYNYSAYGDNAKNIFNWIYEDATICLLRKYDIYLKYL